jgi:hypothetical protein
VRIGTNNELPASETAVAEQFDERDRWGKQLAIRKLERGRDERGLTLVVMMLLLIPVGLLGALFMDAARLYVMRGQMQVAADAAALAAASGFIDGNVKGDTVQARAEYYVMMNPINTSPATLESLTMNTDSGTVSLVLSHNTGSLLLAPEGLIMRIGAKARAKLVQAGEIGRPIPNGNAFGWWKHDKTSPGAKDSGVVKLGA